MQIYKVGGWVRDYLLGITPSDCDYVVVGSSTDEMISLGFKPVGRDFPVFLHPVSHEEYALARTERKTSVGYHGFEFYAKPDVSLIDDLSRRDLTINAIALDDKGLIIDPFNGREDIDNKLIHHVSDSFCEDPLRILRAARFCAQLNFTIAVSTMRLMRYISPELVYISKERLAVELRKGISTKYPLKFLKALSIANALFIISPVLVLRWQSFEFRKKLKYLFDNIDNTNERMIILAYLVNDFDSFNVFLCNYDGDMLKLLAHNIPQLDILHNMSAEMALNLINNLDQRRKPQRYKDFIKLCRLITFDSNKIIQRNIDYLDIMTQKLKYLNWEDVCINVSGIQNKIKYFREVQIQTIKDLKLLECDHGKNIIRN